LNGFLTEHAMKLKLKENPLEWQKNLLVWILIADVFLFLLNRRGRLATSTFELLQVIWIVLLVVAWEQPRLFRGFYRGSMKFNFYVGKVVGRVMLTLFFFVVITPLGFFMRSSGRDFLRLRKAPPGESYWQKCPPPTALDRMF
jgi:hypothetical protein